MKYSIEWLKEKLTTETRVKYIFFWGHQPGKNGQLTATCFSQWWPCHFTVDSVPYKSAEHFMMAEKARLFGDTETLQKIISCRKPAEAKELGRQVKNFDDERWFRQRYEIVLLGSIQKFKQNPDLLAFLISTGDRVIVEASPVDRIWGIGLTSDSKDAENPEMWRGLNLLGFALMEARDQLISEEASTQI